MVKASANSVRIQYAPESTYGTQDVAATPVEFKVISEGFERADTFKESPEITSDATSSPGVVVDNSAAGPLAFGHKCAAYDAFILSALRNTAFSSTTPITNSGAIFNAADNSIRVTAGSDFTLFVVGQTIEVTDAVVAGNKQVYVVLRKAASNLKIYVTGNYVTTDGAGSATIVPWKYADDGTTQSQYTFEREYRDLVGAFAAYKGGLVDTFYLTSRALEFVQGRLDMVFKEEVRGTATGFAGTPSAASSAPLIGASTEILAIFEGGPFGQPVTVTSSTDATPIVVTCAADHNLQTGDLVMIEGHATNTAANIVFDVLRISATTFSLRNRVTLASVPGSGGGAGTGGTLTKHMRQVCFASFDMTLANGIRSQFQIGVACGKDVAYGSKKYGVNVSFFMPDQRMLLKIADNARTAYCIVFKDTNGAQQSWFFPDVELQSQSSTGASGKDADITPTIAGNAVKSAITTAEGALAIQARVSKP